MGGGGVADGRAGAGDGFDFGEGEGRAGEAKRWGAAGHGWECSLVAGGEQIWLEKRMRGETQMPATEGTEERRGRRQCLAQWRSGRGEGQK